MDQADQFYPPQPKLTAWPAVLLVILSLALVAAGAVWHDWYTCGLQSQVYERQGIHVTQWELFCGSQPAVLVSPEPALRPTSRIY